MLGVILYRLGRSFKHCYFFGAISEWMWLVELVLAWPLHYSVLCIIRFRCGYLGFQVRLGVYMFFKYGFRVCHGDRFLKGSFVFAGLLLMLASSGCSWMPYKKQELYLAKMQAEIEARNKASVEMRDARKNEVLAFMKSQRFIDGLVKCIHVSLEKSVFEFSDEMARCPGKVVSGEGGSYKYSKELEAAKEEGGCRS